MLQTIQYCEVCGNKNLKAVLDLGNHPLCDDLIPIGKKTECEEFPIEILFCDMCFTAHQKHQVPKRTLFSDNYHYRARMTGSVLKGMKDLVESCEKHFGVLDNKTILDIGSNDGSLLDFFKEKGCKTIGVEPTKAALESKHTTINKFFNKNVAKHILETIGYPDIITFTNVFAHIENLPELINNIKSIIGSNTAIVIENHYLGAILSKSQFDTFYHEHPRTYSKKSFEFIAKQLGLNIETVQFVTRYGGNIRVFLGNRKSFNEFVDESNFASLFNKIAQDIVHWVEETKKHINELVKLHGPLPAKAFPGRAAILVKLLNLTQNEISAVYEIEGSKKVKHYVPGTRIPILPEKDLYSKDNLNVPIINLAWHLPSEVRSNLKKNSYNGTVFDIKQMRDEL